MARPFVVLTDSFKILRDKVNTTSYNVGDPTDLLTYGDSDVVMAINEIERVFDASAGEILYPTGNALQGETQTRLLISTAQNSGTDIQMNSGLNINLNAVGDINLDAGGANINFLDDSVTRFAYTLGTTNVLDVSGAYDLNVAGNITSTSTGSTVFEATDFTVDASLDIVLDADGDNITFKNGAGGSRFSYTLGDSNTLVVGGNLTQTVQGNQIDSVEGTLLTTTSGTTTQTSGDNFTTNVTGNFLVNASLDIVLDADGNDIIFKNGAGGDQVTHTVADNASYTITAPSNVLIDAVGDIILDAADNDIILKDAGTEFGKLKHIGDNQLGVYSNGILVVSFNDSDAVFNNDVNIENDLDVDRDLNVDRNTTLNGHVDLGNANTDNISIIGRVDTNIVPDADDTYDFGTSALQWRHGFFDGTVTTDSLVTDSADIANFNVVSNTISNSNATTIDIGSTLNIDTNNGLINFTKATAQRLNFVLAAANKINATGSLTTNATTFLKDSATTTHSIVAGTSIAQTAGTTFTQTSGGNFTSNVTGDTTFNASGDFVVDVVGDIILDAADNDVLLKDAGVQFGSLTRNSVNGQAGLTIKSGATTNLTLSQDSASFAGNVNVGGDLWMTGNIFKTGSLTIDASADITLDANGDDIIFRDGASTRITHSLGATNTVAVTGDYVLDISSNATIDVNGGNIILKDDDTQFGRFIQRNEHLVIMSGDSDAIVIDDNSVTFHHPVMMDSALDTTAQNVAGSLNELHGQLDSAASEILVNKASIKSNDDDIDALNTLIGTLSQLDSATGFFSTASINNDSIVKALNELASRSVLVYDESGTLLND